MSPALLLSCFFRRSPFLLAALYALYVVRRCVHRCTPTAVLTDPRSRESLVNGLRALLQSQSLRKEFSCKGLLRSREFQAISLAAGALHAYETAAGRDARLVVKGRLPAQI